MNVTNETKQLYSKARNKLRKETRKAVIQLEKNISKCAKTEPKRFWNYINSKRKNPVGIPDLMDQNGHECKKDIEKANALKEHFESVFIEEDISCLPTMNDKTENTLTHIKVDKS